MTGKKILWVSEFPPTKGGIADYSEEILKRMSEEHEIDVVSSTGEEYDGDSSIEVIDSTPLSVSEWKEILSQDYDILNVQFPGNHLNSLAFALQLYGFDGKSLIVLHEIPNRYKVYFLFRQFNGIAFLTENAREEFQERYRILKILDNLNFYKLPYLGVSKPDISQEILEEKSEELNEESLKIVEPGFQVPRKQYEKVIDAVKILEEEGIEFQLIFAGGQHRSQDGHYAKKIQDKLNELDEENWIYTGVLDSKEELEAYIQLGDVAVLPYSKINQSGILTDVLKLGTIPIVSNVEGLRKPVEEFGGMVIQEDNPEELKKGIIKALKNPPEVNSEKIREELSWENNAEKHLEIYSRLL